jgi:7-carboxy-7-deazaguanine synthase
VLPEYRDEWVLMTPTQIIARVNELARDRPVLVSLSGGNPALHPLAPLIALGHRDSHSFALETQGSVSQPWFAELDWLILSPKPPSSGMATEWTALETCLKAAQEKPRCILKIVIFDDGDYSFARMAAARYPMLPVYLQVGNPALLIGASTAIADEPDLEDLMRRLRWLAGMVLADHWFAATVLPQLHVLAWGNKRGI